MARQKRNRPELVAGARALGLKTENRCEGKVSGPVVWHLLVQRETPDKLAKRIQSDAFVPEKTKTACRLKGSR
jgi:hypothetical protein